MLHVKIMYVPMCLVGVSLNENLTLTWNHGFEEMPGKTSGSPRVKVIGLVRWVKGIHVFLFVGFVHPCLYALALVSTYDRVGDIVFGLWL